MCRWDARTSEIAQALGNVPQQRFGLVLAEDQFCCAAEHLCSPKAAVANQTGGFFAGNPTCMTDISGLAGILVGSAAGICGPLCFQPPATDAVLGGQPLQGTCASADQFCAPCVHPTENTNTGARPPAGGSPDAGAPDAGAPDAGAPDAAVPDAAAPDAGA